MPDPDSRALKPIAPTLLQAQDCALALIDFQARLMPAILNGAEAVTQACKLAKAAQLLGVPVVTTEQNPRGLGVTDPALAGLTGTLVEKMSFGAMPAPGFVEALQGRRTVIITGCETHVCVLQTALQLVAQGYHVVLAQDASSSRLSTSAAAGVARLRAAGVDIVTTEMVLFEWLETAQHPRFRDVLALIK
jgi:nicotinamidase-related amidase